MYRKLSLILVIFMFALNTASSQIGVNVFYDNHISAPDWDDARGSDDASMLSNMYGVSVDYWFRLKNYRIEFLPEVGVKLGTHDDIVRFDDERIEMKTTHYHFVANTNIYVLDLEGDCNCPTFGKEGGLFKKGFYVQVGPGLSMFSPDPKLNDYSMGESLAFFFSLGAGLDIGITKYLTVTPWIRFQRHLNQNWQSIYYNITGDELRTLDIESSVSDLLLGLRVGYRFDYRKSQRF